MNLFLLLLAPSSRIYYSGFTVEVVNVNISNAHVFSLQKPKDSYNGPLI